LKDPGLVSFDGEVIMRLTFLNQVGSYVALGQQGISGNILVLNIDGIKQRDGDFDLIGTFEFFIPFYRQGADFFWV
jgi:hypothetical protein